MRRHDSICLPKVTRGLLRHGFTAIEFAEPSDNANKMDALLSAIKNSPASALDPLGIALRWRADLIVHKGVAQIFYCEVKCSQSKDQRIAIEAESLIAQIETDSHYHLHTMLAVAHFDTNDLLAAWFSDLAPLNNTLYIPQHRADENQERRNKIMSHPLFSSTKDEVKRVKPSGSGTPYFLVHKEALSPFSDFMQELKDRPTARERMGLQADGPITLVPETIPLLGVDKDVMVRGNTPITSDVAMTDNERKDRGVLCCTCYLETGKETGWYWWDGSQADSAGYRIYVCDTEPAHRTRWRDADAMSYPSKDGYSVAESARLQRAL